MPTTLLLLELDDKADLDLLLALAKRLGVKATLGPPAAPEFVEALTAARNQYLQELLHQVYGSWQSDESGEELAQQIYEARTSNSRRDEEIEKLMGNSFEASVPIK